jgi:hypothetical protein
MAIAASMNMLKSDIKSAFDYGEIANPVTTASGLSLAVLNASSYGQIPTPNGPIPLVPAGFPATLSNMTSALTLGPAANKTIVSVMMASAISMLCVNVPPVGFISLSKEFENAFSLEEAANKEVISTMMASAIINYYLMGGVI